MTKEEKEFEYCGDLCDCVLYCIVLRNVERL